MLHKPLCDWNVAWTRAKHSSFWTRMKNSSVCLLGSSPQLCKDNKRRCSRKNSIGRKSRKHIQLHYVIDNSCWRKWESAVLHHKRAVNNYTSSTSIGKKWTKVSDCLSVVWHSDHLFHHSTGLLSAGDKDLCFHPKPRRTECVHRLF